MLIVQLLQGCKVVILSLALFPYCIFIFCSSPSRASSNTGAYFSDRTSYLHLNSLRTGPLSAIRNTSTATLTPTHPLKLFPCCSVLGLNVALRQCRASGEVYWRTTQVQMPSPPLWNCDLNLLLVRDTHTNSEMPVLDKLAFCRLNSRHRPNSFALFLWSHLNIMQASDSSTALIKLDKSPSLCPLTITSSLSGTYNGTDPRL